jgi:subtilisin family serine protease
MRLSLTSRFRILCTFSLAGLVAGGLRGAPREAVTAAQAARELAGAGAVVFPVDGQTRALVLATAEVAVVKSAAGAGGLPGGAREFYADAQHRFVRWPADVAMADWLEKEVAAAPANGTAGAATRAAGATLAPVFYEQGRAGVAAARRVATTKLLLVGLDQAAAAVAAAATHALATTAGPASDLWVLEYATPYQMLSAARALQREGRRVEPQFGRTRTQRTAPNDPLYSQQFYFKNTGQGRGTPGVDLNIEGLWPASSGFGVTIAVVDDGLEITHPDLAPNMVTDATLHLNVFNNSNDPTPEAAANHGTICAGFIAARGGNGIGLTGAAPLARLLGVRLLGGSVTDLDEAAAFGRRTDVVQISSNSWGPDDDGATVSAPDSATLAAIRSAVTAGRGGRGVVFFVATGNGRADGDHAGYDGYSGSRYVIAVGATTNRGVQASFSESGPQVLCVAAGQTSEESDLQLISTDNVGPRGKNPAASPEGDYTTDGNQGTSYSTPQVAGVAALMLQANANLGWRDVKEILIRTARKTDATDSDWVTNGGGFAFNHKYGAGFVDATAAVGRARIWTNLGAEVARTQSSTTSSAIPDNTPAGVTRALAVSGAAEVRVETVEVTVSVTHANRGQLHFEVTSPSGTRTVLGAPRTKDTAADLAAWTFSTPRHWGELANGTWTVRVIDTVAGTAGTLTAASITVYGTAAVAAAPAIATQPVAASANAGGGATFGVAASGVGPFAYQWKKNGETIAGATGATLTLAKVTAADAASYSVVVTNATGSTTSAAVSLTVNPVVAVNPGRLANLSLLTALTSADDNFTMGTVIGGSGAVGTKPLLVRAVGPALGALGVDGTLPDPKLEFFSGSTKLGDNDNWGGTTALSGAFAAVGAFPFAAPDSKDAAIFNPAVAAGGYSIKVSGNGTVGTVIAELYDSTPGNAFTATTPRLINVSVLKQIGTGFTVGFVVGGGSSSTVLVRAIGPGLAAVGLTSGFVPDPKLTLFSGSTKINENDDWGGTAPLTAAFGKVGAFPVPGTSLDAALLATLQPGSYSVQVAGVTAENGLVIVEVYEVP